MNSINLIDKLIKEKENEARVAYLENTWNSVWMDNGEINYENLRVFKTVDKIDILLKAGLDFNEKKVLDIGCGNGSTLLYLNKKFNINKGVGVDISKKAIEKLKKEMISENLEFLIGDHRELNNLKNNYFDIVLSWGVIEHFEEYLLAISEARRVLKAEGFFVLIQPHLLSFGIVQRFCLQLIGKWKFGNQKDFSYFYYKKILLKFGFKDVICFTKPPYPDMKYTRIFDIFFKKFVFKKWGHYLYIIAKK